MTPLEIEWTARAMRYAAINDALRAITTTEESNPDWLAFRARQHAADVPGDHVPPRRRAAALTVPPPMLRVVPRPAPPGSGDRLPPATNGQSGAIEV